MAAALSPGSRAVDPDKGSGDVSPSPGSYSPLHPSLDTLFIGWPIDHARLSITSHLFHYTYVHIL